MQGIFAGKNSGSCRGILRKEQDLPGIALRVSQSPAMISLPACDSSHIPGGLDPVASPAEDLEIIHGPLVTSHGDWPDVIQDVGKTGRGTFRGVGFMDLLPAPGTLPFLLKPDNSPHFGDCGPLPAPVLDTAGGLATEGILVPGTEVCPLPAAMGTGPP